jgi:hypothetical protein
MWSAMTISKSPSPNSGSKKKFQPHHKKTFTQAEAACEDHFIRTHSRDPSGRYNVRLPLIADISTLGNSKEKAQRCLRRLLTQLSRNENLHQRYSDFMSEYESLGHMVPVPSDAPEPPHAYYLPHHGVIREDSKTTKLRVVFNGSSKSSTGVVLVIEPIWFASVIVM